MNFGLLQGREHRKNRSIKKTRKRKLKNETSSCYIVEIPEKCETSLECYSLALAAVTCIVCGYCGLAGSDGEGVRGDSGNIQ
jgi:ribosomal protein S27E